MAEREIYDNEGSKDKPDTFDYSYVPTKARVAVYDDMKMAPRIIEVEPAPTTEYIEKLADVIDEQKRRLGGKIPYSAIREVSENFIHAQFTEVVVSILDGGNTIRFCDQGPGIKEKEKATLPGFTSAIEPMKRYIRGVGSGLPLVKEYLDLSHGKITIEDNLNTGSVVTISLVEKPSPEPASPAPAIGGEEHAEAGRAVPRGAHAQPLQPSEPYAQSGAARASSPAMPVRYPTTVYPVPQSPAEQSAPQHPVEAGAGRYRVPVPALNEREATALSVFAHEGALGVTDLSHIMELPLSSTYNVMTKLEEYGIIEHTPNKKRILTEYGDAVYQQIGDRL